MTFTHRLSAEFHSVESIDRNIMTQVSRHMLDPKMAELIFNEFCGMVTRLSSRNMAHQFLTDFLTETEKIMLSKRYMILILLMRGYTVEAIKNRLYVSNSAVMSVASWYKNAHSGTIKLLGEINQDKNTEAVIDSVEAILEKLPPGKYQNWQIVGQQKAQHERNRKLRKSLR